MKTTAVILAAGQGTRMHSATPKVLHRLAGRPLIHYSVQAAWKATGEKPVVVIGCCAEAVQSEVGDEALFVYQEQQLGTAHAVRSAQSMLAGKTDLVLVFYADMPLLTEDTLRSVMEMQQNNTGPVTILTGVLQDSHGFGRIVRKPDGTVKAIVEEAQAAPEELAIRELNVGVYCFRAEWLWDALSRVKVSPRGEYYLTDTVALSNQAGLPVQAVEMKDARQSVGINNRIHLAEAEALMRQRINEKWMLAGVTLVDPATTFIEASVQIGLDTVIWPNTFLRGKSLIGEGCEIGPGTIIEDSSVGAHCTVLASVMEGAIVEDHVEMGPFCHLRKGAHLAEHVHMGNFGEVKSSYLGPGTKMGHFSYIGDANIGPDVNIGAGTITCNYDGVRKHKTEIGAGAFIGSDTMLVAPVKIGEGAKTGAGAVVRQDVPPGEVAVGVPAHLLPRKKNHEGS